MRTFLGFPIAAASAGNVPFGQMQPQQRSMYARLFDRLNPGSDGRSDADKQAAIRQGPLGLAAGMASTGGQGTAAAIGNGLQSGLLAMNTARTDHLDRQAREQYMQGQLHDPAALREFNELTRIAGDESEPEHRRSAARVRLGLDGRASSAGFSQVKFRSADGRERIGVLNGRTGRIDTPDGLSFDPREVQISPDQGMGSGMPDMGALGGMPDPSATATPAFGGGDMGGNPFSGLLASVPGLRVTSQHRTPERNAEVGGVPNSYHLTGEAIDIGRPSPEQQQGIRQWAQANGYRIKNDYADGHWHLEPARGAQPSPQPQVSLWTSRRPEDDAAETERARIMAQLGLSDQVGQAEARNRSLLTQAEGTTEAGVDYLGDLNDRASKASTEEARLQQLEYALSRTYSGFGAEQLLTLRQIGGAFGIGDTDTLGAGELARSISNQLALGLRNPAGGEGMPGNMSNADREFLQRSVPSLQNSPDGWREMIDMRRRLNQYALEQSREANRYLEAGGNAANLRSHMQRWAEANPLFAAPEPRQAEGRRTLQGEASGLAGEARQAVGGPAPGHVEDGYRFRGGDPADPRNWERI